MFGDTIQTITGIVALLLGMAYVIGGLIVNLHLSYYGVTEYQILRIKYLAVGLVYLINLGAVGTLAAIVATVSFLEHISQLSPIPAYDYFNGVFHISLVAAVLLIITVFAWANLSKRFGVRRTLLFSWIIEESFGAFTFAYPEMILFRQMTLNSADSISGVLIGEAILVMVLALIGQLYFYSRYIYGNVSNLDPIGMGIPVNVQLAGRKNDMALIATMGVPLLQADLTDKILLIDETDEHYIIGIGPTHELKVFKINKELVKGIVYH